MRAAIVTSKKDYVGGVEVFTKDLTKILRDRGHSIDVFASEDVKDDTRGNTIEERVGLHFNDRNAEKPYDVVFCNGEFGYAVDHPHAINIFHGNYFGYAMAVKDLVPEEVTADRLRKAEMQRVSAQGKYVVSVSEANGRQLEEFGIPVDQVIRNTANTDVFYADKSSPGSHVMVASRGRYYEKGFDVIQRLAAKGMKIRSFSDQEIDLPNVENNGFVNQKQLRKQYNQAGVFLSPSRFEGGGLTVLEAMACACPIITTPTGYGREIGNHINNFVAENFDELFTKAFLVGNERERYGKMALDYFLTFHHPDRFVQEWTGLAEAA